MAHFLYTLYVMKYFKEMKAFLFFYVLFDYILVIVRNGWNYKHNSALYTLGLVTAAVFLIYSDDDMRINI
jgi:uncharacterized membrane protein